ncbi:MAG: phosphatidylserine decarboxylase [Synergistaceae bacterium]|nr:phosphatidylserine decarboxylase [Synergistaceae bacterium]
MLKISRYGWFEVGVFGFVFAAACFTSRCLACFLFFPLAFFIYFFRDPDREPERDGWLSPADGRVVEIIDTEHEYLGKAVKIGIFMNGWDVHVNRFPFTGTVEYVRYMPGKKKVAFAPKASDVNERFYVGARSEDGRFLLCQIAGIMARRITKDVAIGDEYGRGERYGMIKLGSKVDLYLPASIRPTVNTGDRVKAGQTVIGVKRIERTE